MFCEPDMIKRTWFFWSVLCYYRCMNILSITAQKPHSTGSGTYLTELVKSFYRAGHDQAVVCGIYPDDEVSFPEGVSCYPVCFAGKNEAGGIHFPIVGMSDIMPYESTRYRDLTPEMIDEFEHAFIDAVDKAVGNLDPDLIVCHHLFLLTALVRKHFPERRICGISHGTDLRQMVNCPGLADMIRPEIARLDMAFALHDEMSSRIKELFGMDPAHVKVLGSGYNDRLFNTEGREPYRKGSPVRLCYAGKISRPKGVPEMLDALELLSGDPGMPEFRLAMAGGCRDEALARRLDDLPSYTDYLGQIPQEMLAELMRSSDIFILPSYFEGLPLVLIEAMASGALPVSTDLPGVREWIDANVGGPNVRYVPMPPMKSIDEPADEARAGFTAELARVIRKAAADITSGEAPGPLPDSSSITWDSVAGRVLKYFL